MDIESLREYAYIGAGTIYLLYVTFRFKGKEK